VATECRWCVATAESTLIEFPNPTQAAQRRTVSICTKTRLGMLQAFRRLRPRCEYWLSAKPGTSEVALVLVTPVDGRVAVVN
jgi:hypothetical protein